MTSPTSTVNKNAAPRSGGPGSAKRRAYIIEAVMILLTIVYLYPFVIMLFISVKSRREALVAPSSFPTEIHLENFAEAWRIMDFGRVFINTLLITVIGLAGIVILSGLAAYTIARSSHTKFYNFFYLFFLAGILIPFYTTLVPLVKLMSNLNLTNSLFGMILYYWGRNMPMAIFLYVGFIRGVSGELLDAGKIDGAGLWRLYWSILFPVLKPITTTLVVLNALTLWNDFLFPRLMLTRNAVRTISLSQFYFTGENGTKYELAFAAYVLAMLPILIYYFLMQKNIIKGIAAGAVKG